MNYETIINLKESTNRITLVHVQEVLERLYAEVEETNDSIEQYCKIDKLIGQILSAENVIGNSSAFHNVAVVLARNDAFDYACDIIELGQKKGASSVDLMADYLNYGCCCNRLKTCRAFFDELYSHQESWNWRAYQFAIDYLLEDERYMDEYSIHMVNDLIITFVEKNPGREEAYLSKANWLKKLSESDRKDLWGDETFESVLVEATSGKYKIKKTPKCDLCLADYYYSLGVNFEKAYNLLEQCKKDSVEIQPSVNRTYVYLLSALCQMSMYYEKVNELDSKTAKGNIELENNVKKVYEQFHLSSLDRTEFYVRNCRQL